MPEPLEARIAPATLSFINRISNIDSASDLVATDSLGNVYVAGVFTSRFVTASLPQDADLTTSDPAGDLYIAKFDPSGTLIWTQTWGGVGLERPRAIGVDPSGDVFITGNFDSPAANFPGGTSSLSTTGGVPQLFALKVLGATGSPDSSWGLEGQLQFGSSTTFAVGTALAFSSGELLIGGQFIGTTPGFNNGGLSLTTQDGDESMVLRISASGTPNTDWGNSGVVLTGEDGGTTAAEDIVFRIQVDSLGSVFVGNSSHFHTGAPQQPDVYTYSVTKLTGANGSVDTSFQSGQPVSITAFTSPLNVDFALDSSARIYGAYGFGNQTFVERFTIAGEHDPTYGFNGSGLAFINVTSKFLTLAVDGQDRVYVGGITPKSDFVARLDTFGNLDRSFLGDGLGTFGKPAATTSAVHLGMAFDSNGFLLLRDSFAGNVDLDPTAGVHKLSPRSLPADNQDGFLLRLDVEAADPGGAIHIPVGTGSNGRPSEIVVRLTGPGTLRVNTVGQFIGDITSIELSGTTLASDLTVTGINLSETQSVFSIVTLDQNQSLGSIKLSPDLILGSGALDSTPDLLVTGRLGKLTLGDIEANTLIKLGQDLPYNLPGNSTPDTYNNRPDVSLGTILGAGVNIEVLGDNTPGGIGGGGLGNVVIQEWAFAGFIKTTQSIGNFTIKTGDFFAVLEVDKFHNGENTEAGVGSMDVQNGDWGSSGSEIEGSITSFNAEAFLAGATITAGSVGKISTDKGAFNGTLTLTDADAKGVASFSVATDFTGTVISSAPLKKIVIKADFRGSLTAPSIAAITAFSFLGDTVDPSLLKIQATDGLLGKITAKSGIVKNFTFMADHAAFSGLNVVLKNAQESTVGIENVSITALSIGPISVQLTGAKNVPGIDLTGIKDSVFTATAPGAAAIGNISVKISGGSGSSTGLSTVSFFGDTVGNVNVKVAKGGGAATARGAVTATFHATQSLGSFTFSGDASEAQVDDLLAWSGGKIGAVNISSKNAAFGILKNSQFIAGQSLDLATPASDAQLKARLAAASFAGLKVSGDLDHSTIAAGANLGAISVGGSLTHVLLLAGTRFGADGGLGGGDDLFQRAARIASVTVKGTISASTISAGVDAVNGVFGDADDVLGEAAGTSSLSSEIGKISLGEGGTLGSATLPDLFAIQAAKLAGITVKGQPPVKDFTTAQLLNLGAPEEGDTDIVIRLRS